MEKVHADRVAPLPGFAGLGWVAQDPRYLIADRQWSSSNYVIPVSVINNLTYQTVKGVPYGNYQLPGVTNKAIYNWEKYNIARGDRRREGTAYAVEFPTQGFDEQLKLF